MNEVLVVSSVLLWLLVGGNLLLTLALVRRLNGLPPQPAPPESGLKPGQVAPDFQAETLAGVEVTRATYTGRSVAFLFVSPTCAPCREALPGYELLRPAAERAGVLLVLVSNADVAATQHFVDELHIRLPILVAPQSTNPFLRDYQIEGTPAYCLIDAQGNVESSGYPSLEWGSWKTLVQGWTRNMPRLTHIALSEGG